MWARDSEVYGWLVGGFAKGCKPPFYRGKPAEVTVQKNRVTARFWRWLDCLCLQGPHHQVDSTGLNARIPWS